jgi:hypothetical protein
MTGISRKDALKAKVCTMCHKHVPGFRDALSEKEYRISGMCQACQDAVYGSGE